MKYVIPIKPYPIFGDDFEQKVCYNEALADFTTKLDRLIKSLNDLPTLDDRFLSTGLIEPITPEYMFQNSKLWKGEWKSVPVDSDIFSERFMSIISTNIRDNACNMVDNYIKQNGGKKSYKVRAKLLTQILSCISDMMGLMNNKKSYAKQLHTLSELTGNDSDKYVKNWKKVCNTVNRELNRMEEMQKRGFFSGPKVEDEIILQNLFLLAYVLATGSNDVSNTFMMPDGVRFKDIDIIHGMLEELGCCILEHRGNDYESMPFMYKAFISSMPKISYRYTDINYNTCLREGCRALSFLNFYSQSKTVSKILKKILY